MTSFKATTSYSRPTRGILHNVSTVVVFASGLKPAPTTPFIPKNAFCDFVLILRMAVGCCRCNAYKVKLANQLCGGGDAFTESNFF